jgi:serine protease AprX
MERTHRSKIISSAVRCPICGQPTAPEIIPLTTQLDPPAVRRLQREHPGWNPASGACPECASHAAEQARLERSPASIQEELLLPFPVYAPDETNLLPVHRLLEASPHYSGRGVTLAFLDSGFYPHPDLTKPEDRILQTVDATGKTTVEEANFSRPQVSSWHGMMTSCVAAGNGYMSDQLYRGIAHQANLVLVKAGNPSGRGISEADIQRALAWVIANRTRYNIRIANISLGGDHPANGRLSALDRLVEEAVDKGIVVIAAAGNDGRDRLVPPASAPSAITVGGLDDRNSYDRRLWRLYHSNYGHSANALRKPEIVAPAAWLAAPMLPRTRVHSEGIFLWHIDKTLERLLQPDNLPALPNPDSNSQFEAFRRKVRTRMIEQKYIHAHYQHVDGTSMAAPVVSAIVAQMIEANPTLSPAQVKDILVFSATPCDGPPARRGAGLVNAGRAVAAARRLSRNVLYTLPFSPHVEKDQVFFFYFDPTNMAERVCVTGSFNDWEPSGHALRKRSPGLWQLSIPLLPRGRYRYKFLVDQTWVNDPENPERIEDGYGGFSSILEVG